MGNIKKYEKILDQYHLDALKEKYLKLYEASEGRNTAVAIMGEGSAVIQVLADLFDIPKLGKIFPGNFHIRFRQGDHKTYECMKDGREQELSLEEFLEKMQGAGGLEDAESVFEGILEAPMEILNRLNIEALTLPECIDSEALLYNDVCAVVLSATRMLSVKERSLIKNPLVMNKCYFLCDLENVHEEEREHVTALLEPYMSEGEQRYIIPYQGERESIFHAWSVAPRVMENRAAAIDRYFKPLMIDAVRARFAAAAREGERTGRMIAGLESAGNELPKYKNKTVRYISTNFIDGIKTNTTSEILSFYEKLNDDITAGVREERNIKGLQEELPNFIAGAWNGYVKNNLNVLVQTNVDRVTPAIEDYVDAKTELFLKESLTEEEFDDIAEVVSKVIREGEISGGKAGTAIGNIPLDQKESSTLRSVLPKCMMALGGIAVLSSCVLPGALLMAAGFKGNMEAAEESKNVLIEAGKKLNYEYLKEVQSGLEQLMRHIEVSTEVTVERCYSEVIDSLIRLIRSYQDRNRQIDKEMTRINADLEAL